MQPESRPSALTGAEIDRLCAHLRPIPSLVPVIERNFEYFVRTARLLAPVDDVPTEVAELNAALQDNLRVLFALCGGEDLWEMVMQGTLCISGSTILSVLEQYPRKSECLHMSNSDIDLYPTCNKRRTQGRIGGHVDAAVMVAMGFEQEDSGRTEVSSLLVYARPTVRPTRFEDKLPYKFQFIPEEEGFAIPTYDLAILQNTFGVGGLRIRQPHMHVVHSGLATKIVSEARLTKYSDRGYQVINGPSNAIRPFSPNMAIIYRHVKAHLHELDSSHSLRVSKSLNIQVEECDPTEKEAPATTLIRLLRAEKEQDSYTSMIVGMSKMAVGQGKE